MGEIIQYKNKSISGDPACPPYNPISLGGNEQPVLNDKTDSWSEKDINSHRRLLAKLLRNDEYRMAKIVAKHLTELQPEDANAWYHLAIAHLELMEPEQAESCILRSKEISGTMDALDCHKMARIRQLQGNLEEAVKWCQKAMAIDPGNAYFRWYLIEIHSMRNDLESAIHVAQEALTKLVGTQEEARARVTLAKLFLSTSAFDQAEGQLKEALRLDSQSSRLWSMLGDCLSKQKKLTGALDAYRKAADIDPGNPHKLYDIGDAYLALGRHEEAIKPLKQVIQLKHDYPVAHYDLSLAYLGLKKYQESEASARSALRYDEDTTYKRVSLGMAATEHLGIALTKQGRFEEAEECFRQNLAKVKLTYSNLGLMFLWKKQPQEALNNFQKALEIDPKNAEYNNLAGDACDELGRLDEAEQYFRRAIEIDKNYVLGHCDLGVFLSRRRHKKEEALASFNKALKIDPDLACAYYGVACTYALEQEDEMALEYLEKAFQKGFKEIDHVEKDHDWDRFRSNDKFVRLLGLYDEPKQVPSMTQVSDENGDPLSQEVSQS
jgi:tetratricopeptide (TPR) repeat protein